jgi:hypothetical protein
MTCRTESRQRIEQIWLQPDTPVLFRRGKGHRLLARLPYRRDNYEWLRADRQRRPIWHGEPKKYWELPARWFNDIVTRSLDRWGQVYIIQPFRAQDACAPNCWKAEGHECECSCMGAQHGSQASGAGWLVVSDVFATRWRDAELACRLLSRQATPSQ